MSVATRRWWGWGLIGQNYPRQLGPLWSLLQNRIGLPAEAMEQRLWPVPFDEIGLRPSRLDNPVLHSLCSLLGTEAVRTDDRARVEHAYGKSCRDLIRIRAGYIPNPPDAVVFPDTQRQIASLLAWAAEREIAIIPFGGGTGTRGSLEPPCSGQSAITLDLSRMRGVGEVDVTSRTVRIQAGAAGPEIEARLNAQGFTLGHFPQSFEFSTLGGWIATRSVGQGPGGCSSIGDLTQAVRVVMPVGVVEVEDSPLTAAGPSLFQLFLGSEGAYGVIAEAVMRVRPLPERREYRGVLFRNFGDGLIALRDLVEGQVTRSCAACLSDAPATAVYIALSHEHRGLRRLVDGMIERYLGMRGYDPLVDGAMLFLGFEGSAEETARQWDAALEICSSHDGLYLGHSAGGLWRSERYAWPYLRDVLFDHGIMADAVAAVVPWSNLLSLYDAVTGALRGAIAASGSSGYVMAHVTPTSEQGALLSLDLWYRMMDASDHLALQEQWGFVRQVAADAIVEAGGVLAGHVHGETLRSQAIGGSFLLSIVVGTLKQAFDPVGIMNPSILLPPRAE